MSRIPWDVWYEDVHVCHSLVYTGRPLWIILRHILLSNRCSRWHILNTNIVHADKAVLHYAYAEFEEARGGIKVCACFTHAV